MSLLHEKEEALRKAEEHRRRAKELEELARRQSYDANRDYRREEGLEATAASQREQHGHAHAYLTELHHAVAHHHAHKEGERNNFAENAENHEQAKHDIHVANQHHALEGEHSNRAAYHAGLAADKLGTGFNHDKVHNRAQAHIHKKFGHPTDHDFNLSGAHKAIRGSLKFVGQKADHVESHPFHDDVQ